MSRRAPALGHADARPRIHVWPQRSGVMWAIGPTGRPTWAETAGQGIDAALVQLGERAFGGAVVICETRFAATPLSPSAAAGT